MDVVELRNRFRDIGRCKFYAEAIVESRPDGKTKAGYFMYSMQGKVSFSSHAGNSEHDDLSNDFGKLVRLMEIASTPMRFKDLGAWQNHQRVVIDGSTVGYQFNRGSMGRRRVTTRVYSPTKFDLRTQVLQVGFVVFKKRIASVIKIDQRDWLTVCEVGFVGGD